MKKHLILALIVIECATVVIAGCASSSSPSPTVTSTSSQNSVASQNSVVIQGYAFSPSTLTIKKGANVTWKNEDSVQHDVVSDSSAFLSPLISKGETYTHQFNSSGSFSYHCNPHP